MKGLANTGPVAVMVMCQHAPLTATHGGFRGSLKLVTNGSAGEKNDIQGVPFAAGEDARPTIAAASRRQAMDWSLVLISQGIESEIVRAGDGAGWALLVSPE